MAEMQKIVVERELDRWVRYRRVCHSCERKLPIKDYQKRQILTVYGAVPVRYPRLLVCPKCYPWASVTLSPATEICPDRATPELQEISANLGARMSYREASNILSTFLPCHLPRKFTTLRHRTLTVGRRIDHVERKRLWDKRSDLGRRKQLELNLDDDLAREIVFNVDTAHIPLAKHFGGRSFEAVVGHCSRGGRGATPGPVFAFEGTCPAELKAVAALALAEQGYAGRGDITVISDGEECLKRMGDMLPQPVTHILDWFHISLKIQPLVQLAATAPDHADSFLESIERTKWRLWNGQPDRALTLIAGVHADLSDNGGENLWSWRANKLLEALQTYIARNRTSVINYSARYRTGQRISTSPAEASVNRLVAKRFVKKQQMRWSRTGAHYLLKVRAAVLNGFQNGPDMRIRQILFPVV